MAIFDHLREWNFLVAAPPEQCLAAFASAFDGTRRGPVITRARWEVRREGLTARAVYRGRAGMAAAATVFSSRAQHEEGSAAGSEISFKATAGGDSRTECSMWLARSSRHYFFFTADARFIRPYMHGVRNALKDLDPGIQIRTS